METLNNVFWGFFYAQNIFTLNKKQKKDLLALVAFIRGQ